MIITLPKDVVEIKRTFKKSGIKAFRFAKDFNRLTCPREIITLFSNLGADMFVSKIEKTLYLSFGPKEKTQFKINPRNGQMACKDLFTWISYAEVPVFDDYMYDDYQIDTKNKIVKVKLVRK